jgi:hypothetical protein
VVYVQRLSPIVNISYVVKPKWVKGSVNFGIDRIMTAEVSNI